MARNTPDSKGFTLIELVTVIMIAAIVSTIAGMGLVQIANGYVFARENAAAAQKSQVALARLLREFAAIKSISPSSATSTSLTYQRENNATHLIETHAFSWTGAGHPITLDGDALLDKVPSFNLTYYNYDYNTRTFTASSYSSSTAVIEFSLTLRGYNDTPLTFVERVTI